MQKGFQRWAENGFVAADHTALKSIKQFSFLAPTKILSVGGQAMVITALTRS